ncbi:hypothetical protein K493DRAFT_300835 [Basidiobolus meristosporus CBS 931.73]|uniref:Uncharacterized protein n=1 Tax=Basidiobolus meristosporus CBS 931.73 TaxID=1314790 RepID=A0A1Y1YF20_9FUNG|nr:hypothetical protein K493DRAFT_300835 [Basidiobolus meristosporus CBS 931.73]|eukprot:ORX96630.1 hypothetical protein K493DRAFT_300835 [Basidiobolus meristosporus CBS 931.73]
MALVEKSNQNLTFRSTSNEHNHRLSISLGGLSRFYTKKGPSSPSEGPGRHRDRNSAEFPVKHKTRSRHNSISSTSLESHFSKDSPLHLENEEVLVDFYNSDQCLIPSILLWKRSIGDSLRETEANYTHQALCIDIQTQEIVKVAQLTDRRIVVVINDYPSNRTHVYVEYATMLNTALAQKLPKLVLKKTYHLAGLNFGRSILALYSHVESELVLISCKKASAVVINSACIFVSGRPQGAVKKLMFIHGSNELCLVTENGIKTLSLSTHLK